MPFSNDFSNDFQRGSSSGLFIPLDGRLTSQNPFTGTLNGLELMYIVSPGNAAQGNSYKITTQQLGEFFAAFPTLNSELITSGATSSVPYEVSADDTRVLFDKILASPSFAVLPIASTMTYNQSVLFKDLKGDSFTNNITISFSNGELCDGETTVVIDNNYGWTTINPNPLGGGWYLT